MPKLIDTTLSSSNGRQSLLSFVNKDIEGLVGWDRFLTFEGREAFHIGNVCDTCAFFFKRVEGATVDLHVENISERLSDGLTSLDTETVETLVQIMPKSHYIVGLFKLKPQPVSPRERGDYFSSEDLDYEDWFGLIGPPHPHDPRTSYFRVEGRSNLEIQFDDQIAHAFEFIIPLIANERLNQARIESFERAMDRGIEPTLVSLSVLDVKGGGFGQRIHWCLAHYLIDGHHKLAAAARKGREITLLAFVAVDHSMASREQIQRAMQI
jgi:hypothetical protein